MKVKKSNVDILSPGFIENEISMKKLLKELNSYTKLSKSEGTNEQIKRSKKEKNFSQEIRLIYFLTKVNPM